MCNHSLLENWLVESSDLDGNKKEPHLLVCSLYVARLVPGLVPFKISCISISTSPSVGFRALAVIVGRVTFEWGRCFSYPHFVL